jgi:hypothetical protein
MNSSLAKCRAWHFLGGMLLVPACAFCLARVADSAEPLQVFCLTTCEMPHTQPTDREREDWYMPTLLTREIVRQGMLLAARESFGVATRDETLREPLAAAGESSRFDFDVRHVQAKRIDYVLRQGDRDVRAYQALHKAVEGSLEEAAEGWQAAVEASGNLELAFLTAALAVRSGRDDIARAMLEKVRASEDVAKPEAAPLVQFTNLLLATIGTADEDAPRGDKISQVPTSGQTANQHFVTAAFLEAEGNQQKAIEHYHEAARSPTRDGFSVILSWIRLRELGEDPHKLTPKWAGLEEGLQ